MRLGGAKCVLDGVNALIAEAGYLYVGSNFGWLGCKALADVGEELLLDNIGWECDIGPDIRAPKKGSASDLMCRYYRVAPYVIDILKASSALPYFLFKGQPICE